MFRMPHPLSSRQELTEMEAFDLLPERIRVALKYASAKHSALEVYGLMMGGKTEAEIFQMIVRTDAMMVRQYA